MRKIIFVSMMMLAASFLLISCGAPAANNTAAGNKPANNTAAAPAANNTAAEADLKKLVTEYAAATAKNDIAAYERTTTDNFMFVGNDGAMYTKAERVASMKSGETKYETLTYDDLNVRVNAEGNGAVVIGRATVKGTNMGKPLDATVRVTQVWAKTKDGWKMASLQATNIAAKADDKKADDQAKADDKSKDEAPKPAAPAANK